MNLTVFNLTHIIFYAVLTAIYYLIITVKNKNTKIKWMFIISGVIVSGLVGGMDMPNWSDKIAKILIVMLITWFFSFLARLPPPKNNQ